MNKYHESFLNSFACENIVGLFSRYKGSAKEITESWGMYEAAKKFIPNIGDHIVIVVGDGCSPRTGAIFAYFTKALVYSVDPNFNLDHWKDHTEKQARMGFPVQRLHLLKLSIEDAVNMFFKYNPAFVNNEKPLLVIWPHSHANMNSFYTGNRKRADVSLPCCVKIPNNWQEVPHVTYTDNYIASGKRIVHFWDYEAVAKIMKNFKRKGSVFTE